MEAMKSCGHIEHRRIDAICKRKGRMIIFNGLKTGEQSPQNDRDGQTRDEVASVVLYQRMVRPGDVQPDNSKIGVLIRGRSNGLKVSMPSGGQTPPAG